MITSKKQTLVDLNDFCSLLNMNMNSFIERLDKLSDKVYINNQQKTFFSISNDTQVNLQNTSQSSCDTTYTLLFEINCHFTKFGLYNISY